MEPRDWLPSPSEFSSRIPCAGTLVSPPGSLSSRSPRSSFPLLFREKTAAIACRARRARMSRPEDKLVALKSTASWLRLIIFSFSFSLSLFFSFSLLWATFFSSLLFSSLLFLRRSASLAPAFRFLPLPRASRLAKEASQGNSKPSERFLYTIPFLNSSSGYRVPRQMIPSFQSV